MAGSGATTPTRRQVELIKAWKINVILGFPAYLRHMALVARATRWESTFERSASG